MKSIADLCLIPLGVGTSLAPYIAECQRVLADSGLKFEMHAYGTVIEGDFDDVTAAIKHCHERVHAMGAARITSTIKIGTRTDRDQTIEDKIEAVNELLK